MTQRIDYFFNLGSPWAYLGLEPFLALTRSVGAEVEPHVIPLIEENGGIYSRNRPEARRAYWMRDLRRWAELRGVPLAFEGRAALADPMPAADWVVAAHAGGEDWAALALALHRAFWSRAENIGSLEVRRAVAQAAGFDPLALEAAASGPAVAARKRESLELAREAGVFGVPTYRVSGELFWGQDSLPFLERHLGGNTLAA